MLTVLKLFECRGIYSVLKTGGQGQLLYIFKNDLETESGFMAGMEHTCLSKYQDSRYKLVVCLRKTIYLQYQGIIVCISFLKQILSTTIITYLSFHTFFSA